MFTITRNEFLQLVRKQRPVSHFEPSAFEHRLVEECQLDNRSACSDAIKALFSLSAEQRDVFILVIAAGYSYEEAARICDCSVGTIKSRISRARAKLTELLSNEDSGRTQSISFRGLNDIFGPHRKMRAFFLKKFQTPAFCNGIRGHSRFSGCLNVNNYTTGNRMVGDFP